jgi:integrase
VKDIEFVSVLRDQLAGFVRMRRSLGYELRSQIYVYRQFDRVLSREMRSPGPVKRPMVEAFLRTLDGLEPLTRRMRIFHVRQFLLHWQQTEPDTFVPDRSMVPAHDSPRSPHIYSAAEIEALLEAASTYPRRYACRRWSVHRTLLGLLYVTGMRISEALGLTLADIDWRSDVIHIRRTKFHKSRLVPFTPSTREALRRYLVERAERGHSTEPAAPLFVTAKGHRLPYSTARGRFNDIAHLAGVRVTGRRGPRLHDMRHTAAVHRMCLWYRQGKDVQALLPALVTYLGPSKISSTDLYITMTPELLDAARDRFDRHLRRPEARP